MIKLRLDVDYPYPSRLKSFLFTIINAKTSKNYLKNSKIIAKMVNESSQQVNAYWFFTPQTIPDKELLSLLHPKKHEVALHVATQPYIELERLEKATKRKVKYYTVHGTARLIARLMWRRKIWEAKASIPSGFPLKSFYDYSTLGLDRLCYNNPTEQAVKIAKTSIAKGEVLHVHPEWLFQRGTLNHRGPYYETLKSILQVDADLEELKINKKGFVKIAKLYEENEYLHNLVPSNSFFEKLKEREIDICTFIERKWCCPISNPQREWLKTKDNIALLEVIPYKEWLEKIGKKTRNMIRKAEKSDIKTSIIEPSEELALGMWKVFNETPIRQGRHYSNYGISLDAIRGGVMASRKTGDTFIAAYFKDEFVGFVQLRYGDNIVVMSEILSLQKFWDKAVNNALIAKAIEVCAAKNDKWLMYGRMGNHPSLDNFKVNNGFTKFNLIRYYVLLTNKGRIAGKFSLHREVKDALPQSLKGPLIPVFNWVSRTRMRIKFKLR
jgi:hypothetical protein